MLEQRYRLKAPTLAPMVHDGRQIPLIVHSAEWEGKALMMFTLDLHERGELVERQGTRPKHIDD